MFLTQRHNQPEQQDCGANKDDQPHISTSISLQSHISQLTYHNISFMQAMSTPPSSKPNSPSTNPPSETSPLISTHNHPHELPSPSLPSASLPTLILYFMALHFLIAFCEMVLVAPLISLFESSLCHSYYNFPSPSLSSKLNAQEITSEMCKIPEIQGPLATIRGWKSFGDTVPGIFFVFLKKRGVGVF